MPVGRTDERGESSRGPSSSSLSPLPPHPPLLPPRTRRGPDPVLVVFRCFSLVTATTALLCVVVNALSAVRSFKDGNDVFDGIFLCYAIVLALFVAVVETEWGFILNFWRAIFHNVFSSAYNILGSCM